MPLLLWSCVASSTRSLSVAESTPPVAGPTVPATVAAWPPYARKIADAMDVECITCVPQRLAALSDEETACIGAAAGSAMIVVSKSPEGQSRHLSLSNTLDETLSALGNVVSNGTSSIAVFGPSCVAVLETGTTERQSHLSAGTASVSVLLSAEDLTADGDAIVDVQFHPLSSKHIIVLTRLRLLAFDLTFASTAPCDDILLPAIAGRGGITPTALAFGAARGWELVNVFILYSDGNVFSLCPWLPTGALLFHSDWAALRQDAAHTASMLQRQHGHGHTAEHRATMHAAGLHLEWLDTCFAEAHGGVAVEGGFPRYVRYIGAGESHPVFGAATGDRWVPGLQGPLRVRPTLPPPSPSCPAVGLHVVPASVSSLPMLCILYGDGRLVTLASTAYVVPGWTRQRQQPMQDQDGAAMTEAEVKYLQRQCRPGCMAWGQQIASGGRGGDAAPGGGWVLLEPVQLPIHPDGPGGSSSVSPIDVARDHVRAGRGTVPGGWGTVGVGAVTMPAHSRAESGQVGSSGQPAARMDVVAVPYFVPLPSSWALPGSFVVASRHRLLLVHRPVPRFDLAALEAFGDAATGSDGPSDGTEGSDRGPLGYITAMEEAVSVVDITPSLGHSEASPDPARTALDINGAVLSATAAKVWVTGPEESIRSSTQPLTLPGQLLTVRITAGQVLPLAGEAPRQRSTASSTDQPATGLAAIPPFSKEYQALQAQVQSALATMDTAMRKETQEQPPAQPAGDGGAGDGLGVEVLARLARASQAICTAVEAAQKLQHSVSARRQLLATVARQSLAKAQRRKLAGGTAMLQQAVDIAVDRADAIQDSMTSLIERADRLQHRAETASSAMSGGDSAATRQAAAELAGILRDLSVRCRTELASIEHGAGLCISSRRSRSAAISADAGLSLASTDLAAYVTGLHDRLARLKKEQTDIGLAMATVAAASSVAGSVPQAAVKPVSPRPAPVSSSLTGSGLGLSVADLSAPPQATHTQTGTPGGARTRPSRTNRAGLPVLEGS